MEVNGTIDMLFVSKRITFPISTYSIKRLQLKVEKYEKAQSVLSTT